MGTKPVICTACGHTGNPKTVTRGHLMIEVILWLMFLVPGIIYSIWRLTSRHQACAMCGGTGLIPVDSPVGQRLLLEHGIPPAPPAAAFTTAAHAAGAALGAAVRRATQPAPAAAKVIPPGRFK